MATLLRTNQTNLNLQTVDNLLENSDFRNNSTSGYGSTPDDWTASNANPVQGGFPAMTKQNFIDITGVSDGDIEGLWNLNEASGNALDLSSNNYPLTDGNTVTSTDDGLMGKARLFTAANSETLSIADASCPNLEITGSQTLLCYFKPTSLALMNLLGKMGASANHRMYMLSTGEVVAGLSGLTTNNSITSDVKLEAGKWHLVALVYNGSQLSIWINGTKKSVTATGTSTDTNGSFIIGADSGGTYINGSMQNAAYLSVALSDSQLKRLWAATSYKGQKIRRATNNATLSATLKEDKVLALRGKTVTLSAQMWQDTASVGQIEIDDGSATASTTSATTGSWLSPTVTKTISATATSITIRCKVSTSDGNAWFKELMLNYGQSAIPWNAAPEDWVRFPRLMRMDIPAVVNGYSFEEGRWFGWTPTYSASGSMTYTSTTTLLARFSTSNKVCVFELACDGTTGGTANNQIYASLPVKQSSNLSGATDNGTACRIVVGGANAVGLSVFNSDGLRVGFLKSDASNWPLSATNRGYQIGSYEID